MNELKAPRNRSLKPCACRRFYAVEVVDGDERSYSTGCLRETNNIFAQGHDAKLVSFLVKADVCGDEIWQYGSGDGHETKLAGAQSAAATISAELAAKAERAVLNALDKISARVGGKSADVAKAAKAQAAAPKKVAVKVVSDAVEQLKDMGEPVLSALAPAVGALAEDRRVVGKVGRWTYEGFELTTGGFSYTTNSGEAKTAEAGKWTKIEK